ncbi:MAG: hypothetical protein ABJC79_04845, partial [Acidimicrobiia bacterium]
MSGDARARRDALRAVRQSPARLAAPEPHVWLPIVALTEEFDALDLSAELELLELDHDLETLDLSDDGAAAIGITEELEVLLFAEGQDDLARELETIESGFWRAAEADHPFLTGELPVIRPTVPSVEIPVPEATVGAAPVEAAPAALAPPV